MELNFFTIILIFIAGLCIGWLYTIKNNSNQQVKQNKQIINLLEQLIKKQNTNDEKQLFK
jgi:lipopolysaccharide export system protein LptC